MIDRLAACTRTTLLSAEQSSEATPGRSPGLRLAAVATPSRDPHGADRSGKSSDGSPLTVAQPRRILTAFPIKPLVSNGARVSRFRILISGRTA